MHRAPARFYTYVRGVDAFGHFGVDVPARRDLEPQALERHRELDRLYRETIGHD